MGNETDEVSVKTSFGVSLLLFEPRSQKVRSYQEYPLSFRISKLRLLSLSYFSVTGFDSLSPDYQTPLDSFTNKNTTMAKETSYPHDVR